MEKSSAIRIIRQTFQNSFNKESFVYFIKSLLNHIEPAPFVYRGNFIPDAYKPYIKTLERIGKYQDKDDKKIDLLIVHLKKETSLERARTMQRNFIAWYLNGSRGDTLKDAALVAFVSPNPEDWRFSLVKMDYRFDSTGEKVKVKQELTPARRFSFLVGKTESSHTAKSRLVPILQDDDSVPALKDLEEAFNIEAVTKEFFEKYRELFLRVKEELDEVVKKDKKVKQNFKEQNIDTVNFAKKLLGQIVFLYFLQKKGWFGVERDEDWGTGPKDFLRQLFDREYGNYQNFFNDILEPLFYEALAIERTDDFYSRFNCKIPFLNGGLFDPINNYDWIHTDILLPNDLFSNDIKTKEGDIGTGILDIFDRYNFTVKEDEPLEKEVAVDPEMLGKVFENLLEVKDRKSKGTYYTPREIVHYMCQQSLINYLKTETKIEQEKIERIVKQDVLLTKDEYLKWKKEKQKPKNKALTLWEGEWEVLDKALENIRIVDPACGSGAFLVGMLQEIVRARNLFQLFNNRKESIYTIKEKSIKSSIYGVDIDLGAVEIAKLRLWLSLIVDEEDIKQIKPLPNLDYKIMQGNSLIELLPEKLHSNIDEKRNELIDQLKQLKDELFIITDPKAKKEKRNKINNLIRYIFEYNREQKIAEFEKKILAIKNQGKLFKDKHSSRQDKEKINEDKAKIKEIKNIKIPGPSDHFEWRINFSEVFQEKGGFDIVIANPPYVRAGSPDFKTQREAIMKSGQFETLYERWDLFIPFIERGLKLLSKHGFLCYITSNSLLTSKFAFKILEYIQANHAVQFIDYFDKAWVFEAGVIPVVFGIAREAVLPSVQKQMHSGSFENILKKEDVAMSEFKKLGKEAFKQASRQLNIHSPTIPLGNICYLSYGLRPNSDERYWRGEFTRDDLISEIRDRTHPKPYIEGKNLNRYGINKILYLEWGTDRVPKKLVRPTFPELYKKPKLFKGTMTGGTYDNLGIVCNHSIVVFVRFIDLKGVTNKSISGSLKKFNSLPRTDLENLSVKFNLKYLLAILNSQFANHFLNSIRRHRLENYFYPDDYRKLPVADISVTEQKPFITLVNKILHLTKTTDYLQHPTKQTQVRDYEKQIDQMVYKLYGLSEKEIEIINNYEQN